MNNMHQKNTHRHPCLCFLSRLLGVFYKGALSIYPPSLEPASFGGVLESTPDTRRKPGEKSMVFHPAVKTPGSNVLVSVVFFGGFLSQMK